MSMSCLNGNAPAQVAVGLVFAVFALLGASPAAGSSCDQRDPTKAPTEAMQGKWTVVEGVITAESFFGLRFQVDRMYVGEAARTITLPGPQSNMNRVGQPWTFYVQRTPIAYVITDCGGSHPGSPTPEERNILGTGMTPRPDEPGFGLPGNVAALGGALLAWIILTARRRRRQPPLTPAGAHP